MKSEIIWDKQLPKTFADGNRGTDPHMALATTTDFYNMGWYKPNACLPAHNAERKYLVEQVSSVLKMVENTFGTISKGRIERHTNATKDINCMMLGTDDAMPRPNVHAHCPRLAVSITFDNTRILSICLCKQQPWIL
ncbi:hypothetical protein HDU86_002601 [Geranomyces michiganensis]|nr:hypothetical protein HDU86_002601 [Geranomyces michiganensis]